MTIKTIKPTKEEVLACVARFNDLKRCETGLPDMQLPEFRRAFYNVLGFEIPKGPGEFSPFGDAAIAPISHLEAGFGLSFIRAEPGKGVVMHTHDTVESFMVIKGTWKLYWEGDKGVDHIVMQPLDFIAVPVGVQRRFECATPEEGKSEGLLLAVIAGNVPVAQLSDSAVKRLSDAGLWPATASA